MPEVQNTEVRFFESSFFEIKVGKFLMLQKVNNVRADCSLRHEYDR